MLPFLSEKYKPASLPEIYAPRRVLLANLHSASEGGFVTIVAPAGSGKTVSALLWLSECKREPVWIGLDGYDNALSVFYKLIATGLYSTQPDNENIKAIIEDAAFSASPVEHTVAIISEMRPDAAKRALVLDDMHLISNREIAKSLPLVIKRLPRSFVTLILSRTELPGEYDILLKDKRCIITSDHLRFSQNETREYFKNLGMPLTTEEVSIVQAATDGWAIGVNAVAQSGDFSAKKDSQVFANFFEAHIWNVWSSALRDFCLKTSVVDEFNITLAERLSGRSDAREIVESLARSNSFVSRLHNDTYRYHHLLQEFLRGKLKKEYPHSAELYKASALYYMEHKDYSMALRFWIDSGDYKGADKFLFLFMFENHHGDIAGYVDFLRLYFMRDFPNSAFDDFPALHICCAWYYYMTGQYKEYERHADEGYKHIIRIALYDPKFAEFAMLMYSVDHRSEMLDKIKQFGVWSKLVKHFSKGGIIRYIASFTHNLPYLHRSSFDYSEVLSTAQNIARMRKSSFIRLLGNQSECIIQLSTAGVCYERNDLESALDGAIALKELLQDDNSIELTMSAKFLYHSILSRMDKHDKADLAMRDLVEFASRSAPFFAANLEAYKTKLRLFDGDKSAARAWLDNYYVVDTECIELFMLFQHFTSARAHIVLGESKNARRYIAMLREFGQRLNRVCDYCEATVLLAVLEWADGNKKEAETLLTDALERLQRYNYKRIVIDEGAAVLPILKRIAVKVSNPEYSGSINREFLSKVILETHRFAKSHRGITAAFSRNQKPIKLSKQQARIIELLSKGYSNMMITAETGLKITTIKTHTAIAYQKLGVHTAIDAVLKAQELGLVE